MNTTTKEPTFATLTPRARIVIQGHRVNQLVTRDGVVTYADCEGGRHFERIAGTWVENFPEWEDQGPTCSLCDAVGHGYPGGGPCPLEERGWEEAEYDRRREAAMGIF
jgi:hypothetical protein